MTGLETNLGSLVLLTKVMEKSMRKMCLKYKTNMRKKVQFQILRHASSVSLHIQYSEWT